jgi:membrane fusion protein, copper/silver efflux system
MKLKYGVIAGLIIIVAFFSFWKAGIFAKSGASHPRPAANDQPAGHQHGAPSPAEKPAETAPQEAAQETPTVEIPTDKQRMIGVRTVQVENRDLSHTIRTSGLVEYDQTRVTTVNTKVEGWIEKLFVNFAGASIKKGQHLADLYSPELWATQQEFINVVRIAKGAKTRSTSGTTTSVVPGSPDYSTMLGKDADVLLEASRQRLRLWDISDEQIKKIEESERPLRTLAIYSPVSGYVLQKQAVQGQKVMAGERLFDVVDLSTVWINADIYEYELPLIKVGDPATVQLSFFPGREFRSRIDYIYPSLSGETRTAKVRFSIPNQGGLLKPQMFTNVELKINLGRKLAVPEDAVIDTGMRKIVYVDKGEGNFEPREVTTGIRGDKIVEITNGLKMGDKVASSANFLIDSEAKLKGVEALPLRKAPPDAANRKQASGTANQGQVPAKTDTRTDAPTQAPPSAPMPAGHHH